MSQFDLFEVYPDRSMIWRGYVEGAQAALAKLATMGHQTRNECYAMNLCTKEIVGRINDSTNAVLSILSKRSLDVCAPTLETRCASLKVA